MSAFCGNPDMTATACHAQAAFPLNLQDNIFFRNSKLDTEGNRVLWLMDRWVVGAPAFYGNSGWTTEVAEL